MYNRSYQARWQCAPSDCSEVELQPLIETLCCPYLGSIPEKIFTFSQINSMFTYQFDIITMHCNEENVALNFHTSAIWRLYVILLHIWTPQNTFHQNTCLQNTFSPKTFHQILFPKYFSPKNFSPNTFSNFTIRLPTKTGMTWGAGQPLMEASRHHHYTNWLDFSEHTLYIIHCTLYIIQCTLYTFTLYIIHFTLY